MVSCCCCCCLARRDITWIEAPHGGHRVVMEFASCLDSLKDYERYMCDIISDGLPTQILLDKITLHTTSDHKHS